CASWFFSVSLCLCGQLNQTLDFGFGLGIEVSAMKNILLVVLIAFALSLCNLSERLHKGNSNSGSSSSGGGSSRTAEPGKATAEQAAAIAGGKEVKWEKQGMSWTIPPNWTEETNESKMFMMR